MDQKCLKTIALLSMILDHFGAAVLFVLIKNQGRMELVNVYYVCRAVGRMAFPLYCYMLVEGFRYTHNLRRYIAAMGIFAIISELPFNYAVGHCVWHLPSHQNVFFTLLLGLVALTLIKMAEDRFDISDQRRYFLTAASIGGIASISYFARTDYKGSGVIAICVMYLIGRYGKSLLPASFVKDEKTGGRMVRVLQLFFGSLVLALAATNHIEFFALFSVPVIFFYNGKRGRYISKYFYYAAYPIHLALFGVMAFLITGGL